MRPLSGLCTILPMISVSIIDHNNQRYDTPGDWQYMGLPEEPGTKLLHRQLNVTVSDLSRTGPFPPSHRWFETALALHEVIEAILCRTQGITEAQVDAWDWGKEWEEHGYAEPGEDPACPYYRQHMAAEAFERWFVSQLGLDWREYGQRVGSLVYLPEESPDAQA